MILYEVGKGYWTIAKRFHANRKNTLIGPSRFTICSGCWRAQKAKRSSVASTDLLRSTSGIHQVIRQRMMDLCTHRV